MFKYLLALNYFDTHVQQPQQQLYLLMTRRIQPSSHIPHSSMTLQCSKARLST